MYSLLLMLLLLLLHLMKMKFFAIMTPLFGLVMIILTFRVWLEQFISGSYQLYLRSSLFWRATVLVSLYFDDYSKFIESK